MVIKSTIHTLLVLLIAFLCLSCKAQTVYPLGTYDILESNYYVKDINNHHDAIVGVWKWEDANSSFEITLQEFEQSSYPNTSTAYYDSVFGKYKYIENGVLISEIQTIQPLPNFSLSLVYESPTVYNVVIADPISETNKVGEFILTSPTTATLELWNSEGIKVNYGNGQDWALPTSLTLTKQ